MFEKRGLGDDPARAWGTRRFWSGWVFTSQFWISRTTSLLTSESLRMPGRRKHPRVTFYGLLMVVRSCSHNDARLRSPYLPDAHTGSTATDSFNPPAPRWHRQGRPCRSVTLETQRLAKWAHVLCLVLGERKDCVQKNVSFLAAHGRTEAGRGGPFLKFRAH